MKPPSEPPDGRSRSNEPTREGPDVETGSGDLRAPTHDVVYAVGTFSLMPTGGATGRRTSARRTFVLQRDTDVSGVSGTGEVAEGTLYTNGVVTVTWYGKHSSTSVWPNFESMLAIHGHGGATRVVWDDVPRDEQAAYAEWGPQ